ncbi:MAG: hypothetical protein CR981_00740 [Proteobacteria bacterium]|nr:MAG: hypothetical protein CR981_00740 [Pseudomonadota bacterium]
MNRDMERLLIVLNNNQFPFRMTVLLSIFMYTDTFRVSKARLQMDSNQNQDYQPDRITYYISIFFSKNLDALCYFLYGFVSVVIFLTD